MDQEITTSERQVLIEWHIPEGIVSKYATNMVVQHSDQEFILSFFELQPPIIFGTPQDLEKLDAASSIRAECIARVIVSTERMPRFIEVLQATVQRVAAKQAGPNSVD